MIEKKQTPPYYTIRTSIKVWKGTFQQFGGSAPQVVEVINELGSEITWARISAGIYRGTVTGGVLTYDNIGVYIGTPQDPWTVEALADGGLIQIETRNAGVLTDGGWGGATGLTIEVYS